MSLNLGLIYSEFNFNGASDSDRVVYVFEEYRLDVARRMLYRGGEELVLPPKAIETLVALIELDGEIVGKDELMKIIWSDTVVEDSNLAHYLHVLRKTLGNKPDGKPYIETLRRRGYRFTSDVRVVVEPETPKINGTPASNEQKMSRFKEWSGEYPVDLKSDRTEHVSTAAGPARKKPRNWQMLAAIGAFTGFFLLTTLLYFQLQPAKSGAPNVRHELTVTPLTSGQTVWNAAISPDGKYFVYRETDGEKTRLWLQQTGQTTRIEMLPPVQRQIGAVTFSPNGEFAYFTTLEKANRKPRSTVCRRSAARWSRF